MCADKLLSHLQKRFENQLAGLDWGVLKEEVFCRFLFSNASQILREGRPFLESLPNLADPTELRLVNAFLQKAKKKDRILIIGDELGLCCCDFSGAAFVFGTEQGAEFAVNEGIKEVALLDDAGWGGEVFQHIVILNLMGCLINRGWVSKLRFFLEKVYQLAGRKGRILIFDKNEYQDDFVCQFVDIGAEIEAIESTRRSFLLRILP